MKVYIVRRIDNKEIELVTKSKEVAESYAYITDAFGDIVYEYGVFDVE